MIAWRALAQLDIVTFGRPYDFGVLISAENGKKVDEEDE